MKQTDFAERLTQALDLRVRASRHSLLGQSAYRSGSQANSPFTIWTGYGIIRVQSVTVWARCCYAKSSYCHTKNPTL